MPERRTYPGYLSSDEHEREERRVKEMVKGFQRWDQIEKVGNTANFCIEVDHAQKTVLLKERNILVHCPFKLSIDQNEVEDIVRLLTASTRILRHHH